MAVPEQPYVCTLSPDLIEKAENELNEKAAWRERDVQALRDMINLNPGLQARMDDGFLLRFLRVRKFDYDRAYQLLINYYQIRAENAHVFRDLTPSTVRHVFEDGVVCSLPRRTPEGRRLYYYRPGQWKPGAYPISDILRANIMSLEVLVEDEETQVNGIEIVGDMGTLTLSHVKHIDRNFAKLMTSLIQESFPLRLKGVHFVNEPAVFSYAFTVIKPLLKDKTQQRLKFHGSDRESLFKCIPKECLPNGLGGSVGPIDELAKAWKENMESREQFFLDMQQYTIASQLQISKKREEEIVDCLVGTYRKLNVH